MIKIGTICYIVKARIHPEVIGDVVSVLSTLRWSGIWRQSYYEISKPVHAPKYRKFFARPVCLRPINDPDPTLNTVDHEDVGDNHVHAAAVIRALAIRGAVLASSTTAALGDAAASIDQLKEKVNHG